MFISHGAIRKFYELEAEEKTTWIYVENDTLVSTQSFFHNLPAGACFEALEPCHIITITKNRFEYLERKIPCFKQFRIHIYEQNLTKLEEKQRLFLFNKPLDRYCYFLQHYKNLANRIPLHIMASFLNMHPSTLSIARSKICI